MITQKTLKQFLDFSPETGLFTWVKTTSTKIKLGDRAGWQRSPNGYRQIGINGAIYYEHRLAWMFIHGDMPKEKIDHVNGIKDDNRISNIRIATGTENLANIGPKKDNTSGTKNVHWCNSKRRWIAKIKKNGKTRQIGSFLIYDDAVLAALKARVEIFGDFASNLGCERDAAAVAWQYRSAA